MTATDKQIIETQINPIELLENLNDAITAIVQLDFKILDLNEGIIQTRVSDTLCHFLGTIISNTIRAHNWQILEYFWHFKSPKNFHKVPC